MTHIDEYLNKIIYADCLSMNGINNIPNNSIDLILTDPPYGMNYHSGRYINGNPFNKIKKDDIFDVDFNDKWLKLCYEKSKENSCLLLFTSYQVLSKWILIIEKYWIIKNLLIWVKNNHSAGDLEGNFGNQYEIIIFGIKGKFKLNGYRHSNVYFADKIPPKYHPTEKPIELLRKLIEATTITNSVVLDPFMGSGSTALACKETNRNYIGFEIDQNYHKKSLERVNISIVSQIYSDDGV